MSTHIKESCFECKVTYAIPATDDQIERLKLRKEKIQDIFPELSPGQRELLISGICEDCFDKVFGDEE